MDFRKAGYPQASRMPRAAPILRFIRSRPRCGPTRCRPFNLPSRLMPAAIPSGFTSLNHQARGVPAVAGVSFRICPRAEVVEVSK